MARLYLDLSKTEHHGQGHFHVQHTLEAAAKVITMMNDTVANNEEITLLHDPVGRVFGVNPAYVVTVR